MISSCSQSSGRNCRTKSDTHFWTSYTLKTSQKFTDSRFIHLISKNKHLSGCCAFHLQHRLCSKQGMGTTTNLMLVTTSLSTSHPNHTYNPPHRCLHTFFTWILQTTLLSLVRQTIHGCDLIKGSNTKDYLSNFLRIRGRTLLNLARQRSLICVFKKTNPCFWHQHSEITEMALIMYLTSSHITTAARNWNRLQKLDHKTEELSLKRSLQQWHMEPATVTNHGRVSKHRYRINLTTN